MRHHYPLFTVLLLGGCTTPTATQTYGIPAYRSAVATLTGVHVHINSNYLPPVDTLSFSGSGENDTVQPFHHDSVVFLTRVQQGEWKGSMTDLTVQFSQVALLPSADGRSIIRLRAENSNSRQLERDGSDEWSGFTAHDLTLSGDTVVLGGSEIAGHVDSVWFGHNSSVQMRTDKVAYMDTLYGFLPNASLKLVLTR